MDGTSAIERGTYDEAAHAEPRMDPPPAIGTDERRMHVRAYNFWVSLLGGRTFPSIDDLDPANIADFGKNSVLLDFGADPENPAIPFLGHALREQGGHEQQIPQCLREVASGSLISRLTDHYLEIIANRAPIGFEAEFVNPRGNHTLYRGILMPFSSDGQVIDFVYGVINWKEMVDQPTLDGLVAEVTQALGQAATPAAGLAAWADGPYAPSAGTAAPRRAGVLPESDYLPVIEPGEIGEGAVSVASPARLPHDPVAAVMPEAGFTADLGDDADDYAYAAADDDAGLADSLAEARDGAEVLRGAEGRSRAALYRALSLAYDFALLADLRADDYHELLADAGLKTQARAPMTPVVKLVFGANYDKTRLTEFAAALTHGRRVGLAPGALRDFLDRQPGGLKGVVAAERAARRPAARKDPAEAARTKLRALPAQARLEIATEAGEFVVLLARRDAAGLAILGSSVDEAITGRLARAIAR